MLELLCVLALVVYLASKLDENDFEEVKPQPGMTAASAVQPPRAPAPAPKPRLLIEGTQRAYLRNKMFVKGFGMNPHAVHDLCTYSQLGAIEQFPVGIAARLKDLYDRGCAVGSDMMELLFHGRGLKQGEAIYFALVEARPEPRVIAFVDKLRTS